MKEWKFHGYVIRSCRMSRAGTSHYLILKDGKRIDSRLSKAAAKRLIRQIEPILVTTRMAERKKRPPKNPPDPNHSLWAHRNRVKMTD